MIRKLIHPILLVIMKRIRIHDLHVLNERPKISANAIYAVNHSCCHDMPVASEVIQEHVYVLTGKQRLDFVSRLSFF